MFNGKVPATTNFLASLDLRPALEFVPSVGLLDNPHTVNTILSKGLKQTTLDGTGKTRRDVKSIDMRECRGWRRSRKYEFVMVDEIGHLWFCKCCVGKGIAHSRCCPKAKYFGMSDTDVAERRSFASTFPPPTAAPGQGTLDTMLPVITAVSLCSDVLFFMCSLS